MEEIFCFIFKFQFNIGNIIIFLENNFPKNIFQKYNIFHETHEALKC